MPVWTNLVKSVALEAIIVGEGSIPSMGTKNKILYPHGQTVKSALLKGVVAGEGSIPSVGTLKYNGIVAQLDSVPPSKRIDRGSSPFGATNKWSHISTEQNVAFLKLR